jgi:hypothetical protein
MAGFTLLSLFHLWMILCDLSGQIKDSHHSFCQYIPSNSPLIQSELGFALSMELASRLMLEHQWALGKRITQRTSL